MTCCLHVIDKVTAGPSLKCSNTMVDHSPVCFVLLESAGRACVFLEEQYDRPSAQLRSGSSLLAGPF